MKLREETMGRKCYRFMTKLIFHFSMLIFSVFSVFLIFMGSFYWDGGNTSYQETGTLLRGFEILAAAGVLFLIFLLIARRIQRSGEKKAAVCTVICGAGMLLLQVLFVVAAGTGIRYDALKVVDEALALFSQRGIGESDLGGYFSIYSNNYAMTIMTHWLIKIFRGIGMIRSDFSNAVLVLQLVNVLFVDAAFAGAWALIKKYMGTKAGLIFVIYMAFNPLSYVWLPFYYTNTCSMMFAIWGAYLLLGVFEMKSLKKAVLQCMAAGILFTAGFQIRATVAIALIAVILTVFCVARFEWNKKMLTKMIICLTALAVCAGVTAAVYQKAEDHYLAFENEDTEFPMTHWIAMGLSDTGAFSPADEAYTQGFATKEEKKQATLALIRERIVQKGPAGVAKLYMKKLAMTFGDGTGGYHSELNISRDYGWLWQIVYGVHRDPLLSLTQVFYMLSLISGLGMAVLLWKGKLPKRLFFFPLFLLGSYLFQMIWEAGTIYSIGTMYVNGCMVASFIPTVCSALLGTGDERECDRETGNTSGKGKRAWIPAGLILGLAGIGMMIRGFCTTKYVEVSMSVDQFLFQANDYIALSDGMEISQTFVTQKDFSTIALKAHNIEGEYNDSVYRVSLYDGEGNLLKEQDLYGNKAEDYSFYPLAFENKEGVENYEIRIKKLYGNSDLIFLYYDTGHYDVYPNGRLTGLTEGDMADLVFEVYWREEE